ncbi:helix-turn-helix domain-containing protein [Stenotrophomonas sp. PD6]|uniref:helix-turn-helix domain-containing protein n=1 Tax=Stenotrophomonas sp. PD6 TaxID=3368612 RepID=UPI003BA0243C
MPKTIHRPEYALLVDLVRAMRLKAGLTQCDVAERLGVTQSKVSDVERGSRRLDVIELRDLARICGTSLPDVVAELESSLRKKRVPQGTKGQ